LWSRGGSGGCFGVRPAHDIEMNESLPKDLLELKL